MRGLRSWVGFRQKGIPYDRPLRHAGEPKYTLAKLIALSASGILSFSLFPLRLIIGEGMAVGAVGIAAGLGASFALSRALSSLLFAVPAHDPATFAAVAAALTLVALAACAIPARRASRVDPMIALRDE